MPRVDCAGRYPDNTPADPNDNLDAAYQYGNASFPKALTASRMRMA